MLHYIVHIFEIYIKFDTHDFTVPETEPLVGKKEKKRKEKKKERKEKKNE